MVVAGNTTVIAVPFNILLYWGRFGRLSADFAGTKTCERGWSSTTYGDMNMNGRRQGLAPSDSTHE